MLNGRGGGDFRYYQNFVVMYFPHQSMTPGLSVGILTHIIKSRGPNYQIKSVMTVIIINIEFWAIEKEKNNLNMLLIMYDFNRRRKKSI